MGAVPREYNFATDIVDRNLKAGRANRPAFIDPRGTWTYGQLADRVAKFADTLRSLGVRREERVLMVMFDTIGIGQQPFWVASRPAPSRCRSTP